MRDNGRFNLNDLWILEAMDDERDRRYFSSYGCALHSAIFGERAPRYRILYKGKLYWECGVEEDQHEYRQEA